MNLVKVDSSMIDAVGYDEQTQTLEVMFKRTGTYRYHNVPKDVYEGLLKSASKGSFMHDMIIDKYPAEQLH